MLSPAGKGELVFRYIPIMARPELREAGLPPASVSEGLAGDGYVEREDSQIVNVRAVGWPQNALALDIRELLLKQMENEARHDAAEPSQTPRCRSARIGR